VEAQKIVLHFFDHYLNLPKYKKWASHRTHPYASWLKRRWQLQMSDWNLHQHGGRNRTNNRNNENVENQRRPLPTADNELARFYQAGVSRMLLMTKSHCQVLGVHV
jgi:hypothetical protein